MQLKLILPFPPSVNNYKRLGRIAKTKSGKVYQQRVNSDETRTFYFQVYQIIKKLKLRNEIPTFLNSEIKLAIHAVFHPPHSRSYDVDNRAKCLLDSLMHAHIIIDDSQIYRLLLEKGEFYEGGKTEISISPIS